MIFIFVTCSEQSQFVEEPDTEFYKGDTGCPIYKASAPFLPSSEVCDIILNPGEKICTKIPLGCRRNATFILDTTCLDHADDFKADDNGSFRHHGTKFEFIEMDDDGEVTRIDKPVNLTPGQYKLSRTYWVHSSTKTFKRRTVTLEDHEAKVWPVIVLQYSNTGTEEDVKLEPHRNSKKCCQPYYATATSTKQRIEEKAKSSLGPSSIFDELYEDGGGMLESSSFASLPRGISQIKYERTKLRRQHSKDTLAELIELCKQSNGKFLHSLQVSPDVRLVLATKAQIADLVKFCCNPENFSVFGIDVTYNIGNFYVTTTTYRHLMLLDKESRAHPNFPGPMMIHTNEDAAVFHYFMSTLKGLNREIENILFVGCDRQKSLENGLSPELPIARFLACKKHVEDNIKRKMTSLFLPDKIKAEFLLDIFGDRSTKGLIDSDDNGDFDARLLYLEKSWDEREIATGKEKPLFSSYFVANIAEDMKEKMLLPVRKSAGLGDNFYFNNCPESMNSCLKKEIDHQKKSSNPGESSKCSYSEFAEIAQKFVEKYRRNIHRAILGDSPYMLAPECADLEVSKEQWEKLSKGRKIAKITLLDECGAEDYEESSASPSTSESRSCSSSQILPDFESTGLPRNVKQSWSNAEMILQKNGVTKIQASSGLSAVISLRKPNQVHIVKKVSGGISCDCDGFKNYKMCSHVIAASQQDGTLGELIAKWQPNLSNIVQSSIPKKSGKKPGPKRVRGFTRAPEQRDINRLDDPLKDVPAFPKPEALHLRWIEGSKITTCYGCENKFRASVNAPPPPPPYDVVLCRAQIKAYTPRGSVGLRFSFKPENVFFHLRRSCVDLKSSEPVTAESVVVSESDKQKLRSSHKLMLRKEFGVVL